MQIADEAVYVHSSWTEKVSACFVRTKLMDIAAVVNIHNNRWIGICMTVANAVDAII